MDKNALVKDVMDKISYASKKIRSIEDDCSKFSVDLGSNGVYIALVAYRTALQEILDDIRAADDNRTSRNNKHF